MDEQSASEREAPLQPAGDVLALVLECVRPLPPESVALRDALGLVVAEDLRSPQSLPRFDNAAMDGFAVRSEDLANAVPTAPVTLPVAGAVVAGASSGPALPARFAVRVATGAPVPVGADAVVRLEDAAESGDAVTFVAAVKEGTNVRRRGEDVAEHDVLLREGVPVGPGQLAAAAAAGLERIFVHRRPRVSVVVTGDEVAAEGERISEAKVFDAIGPTLASLLARMGCRPARREPVDDEPHAIASALAEEAESSDAVITVGGISVGPRDFVRGALEGAGGRVVQVAVRPGKPFGFGRAGTAALFSLPGNPVSALVAFELFVRPAVATMLGREAVRESVQARLTESFTQRTGRLHLVRAWLDRRDGGATVRPVGPHAAGSLGSLAGANAWMVVGPEVERLEEGAVVETWPMLPS
jgi:molybdopterin molybdotransferase